MTTLHLSVKGDEVKQRPILFQGAMVRALLDGSKTQTRRIVKPQPIPDARFVGGWKVVGKGGEESATCSPLIADKSPYGQPGDQLWVRETWAYGTHALASKDHEREGPWVYAADGDTALQGRLCDRWRPSIHMFQSASRITLEITSVRVERLQDISEADAKAEGLIRYREKGIAPDLYSNGATEGFIFPVDAYSALWEQINGPGSWDANPWVWVVSFRAINVKGSK
jgi:hypothetical protein